MDAERCWAGSRKGARKVVVGEMRVRESIEEARRKACNRGGIVAVWSCNYLRDATFAM